MDEGLFVSLANYRLKVVRRGKEGEVDVKSASFSFTPVLCALVKYR